jgi:hypothetical protein
MDDLSVTPVAAGTSTTSMLWSALAAAAVLLVGLGTGLALRRSRQR